MKLNKSREEEEEEATLRLPSQLLNKSSKHKTESFVVFEIFRNPLLEKQK